MIHVLEGYGKNILAVTLSGTLTYELMGTYWGLVEDRVKSNGADGLNLLLRIDNLRFDASEATRMIGEAMGTLFKRITQEDVKHLNKIAVVGHSEAQRRLVEADSLLAKFWNKKIEEKYFDIEEFDEAKEFVSLGEKAMV